MESGISKAENDSIKFLLVVLHWTKYLKPIVGFSFSHFVYFTILVSFSHAL